MTKVCSKCKEEKPLNIIYFGVRKASKDGFQPKCKICARKYSKIYAKKHPEVKQNWNKNNPEALKAINNRWVKKLQGVYGIWENGKCLYIGESSGLLQRISNHKSNIKNPEVAPGIHVELYKNIQQHKNWVIGIIEQCNNHKEREKYYIKKLNPLYNGD